MSKWHQHTTSAQVRAQAAQHEETWIRNAKKEKKTFCREEGRRCKFVRVRCIIHELKNAHTVTTARGNLETLISRLMSLVQPSGDTMMAAVFAGSCVRAPVVHGLARVCAGTQYALG